MAFTLASRIRNQFLPDSAPSGINIRDFEYHEPVVEQKNTNDPQPIRITAEAHLDSLEVQVKWYNPQKDLWYSHATVSFKDPLIWLADWARSTKLITSRIETLNTMALSRAAGKLKTDLAYSLCRKLVSYSEMYQTMQSVILNEDEAVAKVVFPSNTSSDWIVPPHFINGCVSLSGFALNGSTHFDNTKNFVKRGLVIVEEELAVDTSQLTDEVELADLRLDSLMSLVLSQKLRDELGIEMREAFFLEVDTIGSLKKVVPIEVKSIEGMGFVEHVIEAWKRTRYNIRYICLK